MRADASVRDHTSENMCGCACVRVRVCLCECARSYECTFLFWFISYPAESDATKFVEMRKKMLKRNISTKNLDKTGNVSMLKLDISI